MTERPSINHISFLLALLNIAFWDFLSISYCPLISPLSTMWPSGISNSVHGTWRSALKLRCFIYKMKYVSRNSLINLYLCISTHRDRKKPDRRPKYSTSVQHTSSQNIGQNLLHGDGVASLAAEPRKEPTSRRWCRPPRRRTSRSQRRSSSDNTST